MNRARLASLVTAALAFFVFGGATDKAAIEAKPEPANSKEGCRGGLVRLRAVLAADGRVKYILPLQLLPDGLTDRAMDAARKIKFKPATRGGRPVSQWITLEYNFNC